MFILFFIFFAMNIALDKHLQKKKKKIVIDDFLNIDQNNIQAIFDQLYHRWIIHRRTSYNIIKINKLIHFTVAFCRIFLLFIKKNF